MDSTQILAFVKLWLPATAVAIGALVRVLKSDTTIPITIPPQWRSFFAAILGVVSAILQAYLGGLPWMAAIISGLGGAGTAVAGHKLLVENLRGGKEFGLPKFLTKTPPPQG